MLENPDHRDISGTMANKAAATTMQIPKGSPRKFANFSQTMYQEKGVVDEESPTLEKEGIGSLRSLNNELTKDQSPSNQLH